MLGGENLPAFHYGSHYSNSGIIAHYLIRIEPFTKYAVKLQGGCFDVADRLFQSIEISWEGSSTHSSDYKELIPEFFTLPEVFKNLNRLNMGRMQNGIYVGDVTMPAWAGTPENFTRIHQKALESPYVSKQLHKWIDLIFGYK